MAYTQAELNAMSSEQLTALGDPVATDAPYAADYNPLAPGGPYDIGSQSSVSGLPS